LTWLAHSSSRGFSSPPQASTKRCAVTLARLPLVSATSTWLTCAAAGSVAKPVTVACSSSRTFAACASAGPYFSPNRVGR
jgi:hypothetical protein